MVKSMNTSTRLLDQSFNQDWLAFITTYGALRWFSKQLPALADPLDEQIVEELAEKLADVFDEPSEQIRSELIEFFPNLEQDHLYPDFYNEPDLKDIFQTFRDTNFRHHVLKWQRENSQKANVFLSAWGDYMAQPPLSGIVLRKSVLINLVSLLEIFVDSLLKTYSLHVSQDQKQPERLDWQERWKLLEELIPAEKWLPYKDTLREMIARRNALVHQGGRITEKGYLRQTQEINSLRPADAAEGRFLLVPTDYLIEALNTVVLFAFALNQAAWREHKSKKAVQVATNLIYQMLRQKQYLLVEQLSEIALPGLEWKDQQLILVNLSIAYREQRKTNQLNETLQRLDRKKCNLMTQMAKKILREQNSAARDLLKEIAKKNQIHKVSIYWPLFDPVRNEDWFRNLFAKRPSELPSHSPRKF